MCEFSIATSEKFKDKTTTEWHNIVIWGKLGEIAQKYLKKGSLVYLEGKIQSDQYEKDGEKRTAYKIVCFNMKMLDQRYKVEGEKENNKPIPNPITDYDSRTKQSNNNLDGDSIEDLPF